MKEHFIMYNCCTSQQVRIIVAKVMTDHVMVGEQKVNKKFAWL